ncbi:MAG: MBL fold metallo-hydrolase [Chloroflexi bacterium]|nr:MBL fold metallo-hydrolase [Chloroflexota bacterium]
MELVLLGTGSPLPNPDRCGAGQAVVTPSARVLVDCGWGIARRAFAAGLMPPRIDALCLTHLHSDHITDIPDLLIMRWTGGATQPLRVFGPEGTQATIDGFLAGVAHDIAYRRAHHGDKLSARGVDCDVTEVPATADATPVAAMDGLTIEAFEVDHFPVVPALGYRFRHEGKTLVMSGDTKPCENLVRAAKGADLLLCEAMNIDMFRGNAQRLAAAGQTNTAALLEDATEYHSTTLQVAAMARDAGVARLLLSHIMPYVPTNPEAIAGFTAGMSDIYGGPIEVGHDLMRTIV